MNSNASEYGWDGEDRYLTFFPTKIPTPRLATYNINSCYFGQQNNKYNYKQALLHHNLKLLTRTANKIPLVIGLQETLISQANRKALKKVTPDYLRFYNSLSTKRAGTLTLVHKTYLRHYEVKQIILQQGYISYLEFTPKLHSQATKFQVYNIYTVTSTSPETKDIHWDDTWLDYEIHNKQDTLTARKQYQLQLILNSHRNITTFMMGDFNSHSWTKKTREKWAEVCELFKLRQHKQPLHTFHRGKKATSIDKIFSNLTEADASVMQADCFIPFLPFNPLTNPNNCEKLANGIARKAGITNVSLKENPTLIHPSDHFPVALDFQAIKKFTQGKRKTITTAVAKRTEFIEAVQHLWNAVDMPTDPFAQLRAFKHTLHQANKQISRKAHDPPEKPHEIVGTCVRLYREAVKAQPSIQELERIAEGNAELLAFKDNNYEPKAIKLHLNKLIKEFCNPPYEEENEQPNEHVKAKTNILRDIKLQLPTDRVRIHRLKHSEDDEFIEDPDQIASAVADYWSQVWAATTHNQDAVDKILRLYPKRISLIHKTITLTTIQQAIKQTNDSVPGPDGIPFQAYRTFIVLVGPILLRIAEELMRGNTGPPDFNFANLFVLPKDLTYLVSRTRPISVPNTDNRILAKALLLIITPACQSLLDTTQTCLRGRNIADNIRKFNTLFYEAKKRKVGYYLLLLDFRKAFDSVRHRYIIDVMTKLKFPVWVCNMIKGFLNNLAVYTTIAGAQQLLVAVENGMKQGCPLSPLLYALILDPLLYILQYPTDELRHAYAEHKLVAGAYVDDVGAGFRKIRTLLFIIHVVTLHTKAAGGAINDDKTILLYTLGNTNHINPFLQRTNWPRVKYQANARYLGVLFGVKLSTYTIYQAAYDKFVKRTTRYIAAHRHQWFTVPIRIIIANVWLIPVFSYLNQFFLMPDTMLNKVNGLLAKFLVPTRAFKLELLMYPPDYCGLLRPLRSLSIVNITTLATLCTEDVLGKYSFMNPTRVQGLFRDQPGRQEFHVTDQTGGSLLIEDHIFFAYHCARKPDGYNCIVEHTDTRKEAYSKLFNSEYSKWYAEWDVALKLKLLRIRTAEHKEMADTIPQAFYSQSTLDETFLEKAKILSKNFAKLAKKLKPNTRWHQCKLTFHACLDAHRMRHFSMGGNTSGVRPHLEPDQLCFICAQGLDDWRHIYFACLPVAKAYRHLVLNYGHGYGLDCDLTIDTLLLTEELEPKACNFQTLFNAAVWIVRNDCETRESARNSFTHIVRTFTRLAGNQCPSVIGRVGTGSKPCSDFKKRAIQKIQALLAEDLTGTILLYVDGSAQPNPGPGGSGVYAVYGDQIFERYTSLGPSTNNQSEIFSTGMACDLATHLIERLQLTYPRTLILQDSLYSLGVLFEDWKHTKDPELIQLVQKKADSLGLISDFTYIYCPGHVGIDGNESVDGLAKKGADDSNNGLGISVMDRIRDNSQDLCVPVNKDYMYFDYPP